MTRPPLRHTLVQLGSCYRWADRIARIGLRQAMHIASSAGPNDSWSTPLLWPWRSDRVFPLELAQYLREYGDEYEAARLEHDLYVDDERSYYWLGESVGVGAKEWAWARRMARIVDPDWLRAMLEVAAWGPSPDWRRAVALP